MLYLAYGSNLNLDQMAVRCPDAEPLHGIQLNHFKLIFRNVADITEEEGALINLGVFSITDACEEALDRYEGFPTLYTKMYLTMDGEEYMTYTMHRDAIAPPSSGYYDCIKQGYQHWGFETDLLEAAQRNSFAMRWGLGEMRA
tara:strand:+ start:2111 stop:2539 length:429 start_codon:yes stop_codon:yes gene_type:complete